MIQNDCLYHFLLAFHFLPSLCSSVKCLDLIQIFSFDEKCSTGCFPGMSAPPFDRESKDFPLVEYLFIQVCICRSSTWSLLRDPSVLCVPPTICSLFSRIRCCPVDGLYSRKSQIQSFCYTYSNPYEAQFSETLMRNV